MHEKIIIYSHVKFEENIKKIYKSLISNDIIKNLKELSTKNMNILLLGGTNVGKSTLINEFLNLEKGKRERKVKDWKL